MMGILNKWRKFSKSWSPTVLSSQKVESGIISLMSKSGDFQNLRRRIEKEDCDPEPVLGLCIVCGKEVGADSAWSQHLPCLHYYHENCWHAWYWKHNDCPCVMRQQKKKEEEKPE
jgi:hypothetical protein